MLEKGKLGEKKLLFAVLLLALLALTPAWTQTPSNAPSRAADVVAFLNKTVGWYQQATAQQQVVRDPGDLVFFNDSRQTADQIVRLSFEFARARAKSISSQPNTTTSSEIASSSTQYQKLADAAAKADQKVQQTQQEIDGFPNHLPTPSGTARRHPRA